MLAHFKKVNYVKHFYMKTCNGKICMELLLKFVVFSYNETLIKLKTYRLFSFIVTLLWLGFSLRQYTENIVYYIDFDYIV